MNFPLQDNGYQANRPPLQNCQPICAGCPLTDGHFQLEPVPPGAFEGLLLQKHFLCGTGTTATIITARTGLPVRAYNSDPLGGDQQISAKIVEGAIDFLVFFFDPLCAQPHNPDVKALLRIAILYDIPIVFETTALSLNNWCSSS